MTAKELKRKLIMNKLNIKTPLRLVGDSIYIEDVSMCTTDWNELIERHENKFSLITDDYTDEILLILNQGRNPIAMSILVELLEYLKELGIKHFRGNFSRSTTYRTINIQPHVFLDDFLKGLLLYQDENGKRNFDVDKLLTDYKKYLIKFK